MIYRFSTLASTNDEAALARYTEGDVILARSQTSGRGQRGHRWESEVGQNLTFSLVLEPTFLAPAHQFLLSEAVALGVVPWICAARLTSSVERMATALTKPSILIPLTK